MRLWGEQSLHVTAIPTHIPQASCRTWGLFHAVLMRQTLCFYQDRKDSLKVWCCGLCEGESPPLRELRAARLTAASALPCAAELRGGPSPEPLRSHLHAGH